MMRMILTGLIVVLGVVGGPSTGQEHAATRAVADDTKKKSDLELMQGTWVITSCEVGTKEVTSPGGDHLMEIVKDKIWITRNGVKAAEGMTFKIDESKHLMDLNLGEDRL